MSSFREWTEFGKIKSLSALGIFVCIPGFKDARYGSKRIKIIPETQQIDYNLLKKIEIF